MPVPLLKTSSFWSVSWMATTTRLVVKAIRTRYLIPTNGITAAAIEDPIAVPNWMAVELMLSMKLERFWVIWAMP